MEGSLPPQLDQQTYDVLKRLNAVMLLDAAPTFTPTYNGVTVIYPDGSDYYFAIYANGAWRSQKLGITAPTVPVFTVLSTTISVPGGTTNDTSGTWATGLTTCDFIVGNMALGGVNKMAGFWKSGLESPTSIATDGFGAVSVAFLGLDGSQYFNNLSFSAGTLTYHYKNTGGASYTVYLWAIGTV
jgi:hypothetical protein